MPKLKTHKGLRKRVKLTKSGKIKRKRGFAGHLMSEKSGKRRRHLRKKDLVSDSFSKRFKRALGK